MMGMRVIMLVVCEGGGLGLAIWGGREWVGVFGVSRFGGEGVVFCVEQVGCIIFKF